MNALRHGTIFFLGAAMTAIACSSSDSTTPATNIPPETTRDGGSVVQDPGCNTHEITSKRDAVPTAACATGATCVFAIDSDPAICDKGGTDYPAQSTTYQCDCAASKWACSVTSGSSSLLPCPGKARTKCATADSCTGGCAANEDCYTQITCTTAPVDGGAGSGCSPSGNNPGDDACHAKCATADDCPTGQSCKFLLYPGCTTGVSSKGICCSTGECD